MGMFGSALKKIATPDNLYLLGATLKDIGSGGTDNFLGAQQMLGDRRSKAQKAEMVNQIGGLFGGQARASGVPGAGGSPGEGMGSGGGIDLRNPETQALLFRAQQAGIDVKPLIEMYSQTKAGVKIGPDGTAYDENDPGNLGKRFANRSNVNGTIVDLNDPNNTNRAVSEAPVKGAMPVYDNLGQVVDWRLPQGVQGVLGAAAEAGQLGQTRGNMINVPRQGGGTAMMTGGQFLDQGQGGIPGLGMSQSPSEAAAANIEATAGANARVGLPQAIANSDNTISVIDKLISHPALKSRTGMFGVVPAIPGTPGVGFDTLRDQLKGQVFMQAFNSLKGAGQITETEGAKATNAMSALNTAQTTDDFVSALNDLKSVIARGKERAAAQAGLGGSGGERGGSRSGGARPAPPAAGQVVKGYRFLGGDPASPRSWQRAQ